MKRHLAAGLGVLMLSACSLLPSRVPSPTPSPTPTLSAEQHLDAILAEIRRRPATQLRELRVSMVSGDVSWVAAQFVRGDEVEERSWQSDFDGGHKQSTSTPSQSTSTPRDFRPIPPERLRSDELLGEIRRFATENSCPGRTGDRDAGVEINSLPDGRSVTTLRCPTKTTVAVDGRTLSLPSPQDPPEVALGKAKIELAELLREDQVTSFDVGFDGSFVVGAQGTREQGTDGSGEPCVPMFNLSDRLHVYCHTSYNTSALPLDQVKPKVLAEIPNRLGAGAADRWSAGLRIDQGKGYWKASTPSGDRTAKVDLDGNPLP